MFNYNEKTGEKLQGTVKIPLYIRA